MRTVTTKKLALEPSDNKRVVLEDGVSTKAHGYKGLSLESDL